MTLKVVANDISTEIKLAVLQMDLPVKNACAAAVVQAGEQTKTQGRANIKAHLGARLANAWSVRYYPGGGKAGPSVPSIDAAAFVYHKIPFVSMFQDGGTIAGAPLLWIPLKTTPLTGPWRGRVTPKKLASRGVKLFSLKGAREPLLAAKLPAFDPAARRKQRLTVSRVRKSFKINPQGKALTTVPLFVGLKSVTIRKRLRLREIANEQTFALPQYYVVNLKV